MLLRFHIHCVHMPLFFPEFVAPVTLYRTNGVFHFWFLDVTGVEDFKTAELTQFGGESRFRVNTVTDENFKPWLIGGTDFTVTEVDRFPPLESL